MLQFGIRILPFIAIAIVNFVFSWLWYSPMLFAKPWAKALKIKMNAKMTPKQKAEMPWLFVNAIVSSFLLSYVLQVLVNSTNSMTFGQGATVGLTAWLGLTLTASLGTKWEGRPTIVLVVNNGLYIVTYALFGGILAVWR